MKKDSTHCDEVEPGLFAVKLIDGRNGSREISLLRGWLRPGSVHLPHTHGTEEAVTFLSGIGVVTIGGKDFHVEMGDSVCIPPHVVHSTHNTGAEDLTFIAAFSDSLVSATPANPRHGRHRTPTIWQNQWHWWFKRLRRWLSQ